MRRVRIVSVPAILAGLALAGAAPVHGQGVEGIVLDATTSAPLPGVLVSLLDPDGQRVRAVLTDEAGGFSFRLEGFGRYALRAERIGLQTTTSRTFEVFGTAPHEERILMGERAIEIEGLLVDSRVEQCRIDEREAVQIQRWWQEVRTALDVASVVQEEGLAHFEIARFEREWDVDLDDMVRSDSRAELALSNRPFVSAEADFLVDEGFVQGERTGQREYYAPDGDVLLSDVFLATHCFSVTRDRRQRELLGLAFEPNRRGDVPDIRGTLWVDTTTAELRSLDFRYVDTDEDDGIEADEAGGRVSFEYLPSGAWIVDEWYIRMPRLGERLDRNRVRISLLGYVDVGGEVRAMATGDVSMDGGGAVGSVGGVVWDSIHGRGLAEATVSVLGTRLQARTQEDGSFLISGVPAGEHRVAFFHDDPAAWGLGASFARVRVRENRTAEVELGLPRFRTAARVVCLGSGAGVDAVLIGRVVDRDGEPFGNMRVVVEWTTPGPEAAPVSQWAEVRTGVDGRWVICTVPPGRNVRVSVEMGDRLVEGFELTLPPGEIVFRQMMLPVGR